MTTCDTGVAYTFSADGSTSDLGHSVEYRFDWGDGSISNWSAVPQGTHTWLEAGSRAVKAQARCVDHQEYESLWSYNLVLSIFGETIFPLPPFPLSIFELLLE